MTLESKQAELQALRKEFNLLNGTPDEKPGLGSQLWEGAKEVGAGALETVGEVGQFVDRYTGAPTRAAIGSLQEDVMEPGRAASAAFDAFGNPDQTQVPTGKDIAAKAGLSKESMFDLPLIGGVSPAGVAGLGVDVVADPTNIIPIGAGAKLMAKGAKAGAKGTAKAAKGMIKGGAKVADVATGTKGIGNVVEKTFESAGDATDAMKTYFTPKRALDYDEMAAIATKNGIDPSALPEAVEFGKGSFISRASRKEAEGVLGQRLLAKHEAATDQINAAFNTKVASLSDNVLDPAEAGKYIRDSFDDSVDEMFNQVDFTYSTAGQQIPGLNIKDFHPKAYKNLQRSLLKIEDEAIDMQKFGVTGARRTQGQQLEKAVEIIRSADGDYNTIVKQLREVGEAAFKSQNILADIPPDIKKLRKMYFDTQDTLIETTRQAMGDEVADNLILNNKYMKEFFADKSIVANTIGNKKLSDEKVFMQLISNGDTKKIEALGNILGPDKMKQLKGAFVDGLVKKNIEGDMGFRSVSNALRNKKLVASKILDPQELTDLNDILRLGDRMDIPIMSTSGTGASQSFGSVAKSIPESMVNRQIIEKMKNKARGVSEPPPQPIGNQSMMQRLPSRTPLEKGTKAAQVYGQQRENQRRGKADELKQLMANYQRVRN